MRRRMAICSKQQYNKTVISPVIMYGSETWALRKAEEDVLERTEMRILRRMMGISEKIREARLRWLGHVERKTEEDVVMRTWKWVDTER